MCKSRIAFRCYALKCIQLLFFHTLPLLLLLLQLSSSSSSVIIFPNFLLNFISACARIVQWKFFTTSFQCFINLQCINGPEFAGKKVILWRTKIFTWQIQGHIKSNLCLGYDNVRHKYMGYVSFLLLHGSGLPTISKNLDDSSKKVNHVSI